MENRKVILRTSLQGMSGKLASYGIGLVVVFVILSRLRGYQLKLFETHEVGYVSAITQSLETEMTVSQIVLLSVSYLLTLAMLGLLIFLFWKLLSLTFELTRVTVIDFGQNRMIEKRFRFPFHRIEDENSFHQIVQVRLEQNLLDRLTNGGSLYIEYLVLSKLDSQLRMLEVPYLKDPERVKKRLIE